MLWSTSISSLTTYSIFRIFDFTLRVLFSQRFLFLYFTIFTLFYSTWRVQFCGIRNTIKGYLDKGINYIYECSRGIKKSALDGLKAELLDEFENNPPSSIPEAVSRIKEKFGITLTETPVRNWLRNKASLPQIKTDTDKSKPDSTVIFSEKHPASAS